MQRRDYYVYHSSKIHHFWDNMELGWYSCLMLSANIGLFVLAILIPAYLFGSLYIVILTLSVIGIMMAMLSMTLEKIWWSQVYAMCGLMGNICLPLLPLVS